MENRLKEYANISDEAIEASKKTCWPIISMRDCYAFGYEVAKDKFQSRIASLEAQLEKAEELLRFNADKFWQDRVDSYFAEKEKNGK